MQETLQNLGADSALFREGYNAQKNRQKVVRQRFIYVNTPPTNEILVQCPDLLDALSLTMIE
jgi:hypothetical protein